MDPVLKSWLSSGLLGIAMAFVGVGVSHGLIPATDQASVANWLVTGALGLIAFGIARFKGNQNSLFAMIAALHQAAPEEVVKVASKAAPTALIAAVNNSDNGVKVVPDGTPVPPVTAPLK